MTLDETEIDNRIRDNSKDPKYFWCFSYKCGIYTMAIYIIIDLTFDLVQGYFIYSNEYFHQCYFIVYMLCLIPQFVALYLVLAYFIEEESEKSRERLPTAMILAFVTSLTLSLWITIYICFIYDSDDDTVQQGSGDKSDGSNY